MGWSFEHRDKGTSNLEHFRKAWAEGYELLDGATVGGTFYGALRRPDGLVEAVVILTKWVPRDWFNFGEKSMTESWGPTEARCPERILAMLSPTELLFGVPEYETVEQNGRTFLRGKNGAAWAIEWRKACRDYHARVGKVKRGTVIRHAGTEYTAVDLRRNLFRGNGITYRFPHWRTVNFEVIPAA